MIVLLKTWICIFLPFSLSAETAGEPDRGGLQGAAEPDEAKARLGAQAGRAAGAAAGVGPGRGAAAAEGPEEDQGAVE